MPVLELVTRDIGELSEADRSTVEHNAKILMHATISAIGRVTDETRKLLDQGETERAEQLSLAIGLLGNLLDGSLFLKERCEAVAGPTRH